jgi:hypothetical protein
MKTILGLLIVILIWGFTPSKEKNKIYWSKDNPLQWEDFKGPKVNMEGIDAWTVYYIDQIQEEGKTYIKCYFDTKESWRNKKKENDYLLRHEQYHFNLAEVFARKIRKEIIETKVKFGSIEFKKIFNKNFLDLKKMQNAYDKDTKHSRINEEQAKWESKIDQQLQELIEFSNPMID